MRVLVIDDSKVSRKVQAIALAELGLAEDDIVEAEKAKEAFKIFGQKEIDLILLDWNMPEITDVDFIRIFKTKFPETKIPIVMVTSDGRKESIVEASSLGVSGYIVKPIDRKEFKAKVFQLKEKNEDITVG
ncbi:response regulator [Fibrobacterales bacterium]|nr:response regulator [Fibrobacterales bacterium]